MTPRQLLPALLLTLPLQAAEPTRLAYRHPGLTVDLGVGLWAWPLPLDFDGDGDLDLAVSCSDVPYNGLWLFENPGGSDFPVFQPGRRVSKGMGNVGVSYVGERAVVLSPGKQYPEFLASGFDGPAVDLGATTAMPVEFKRTRANQWKLADLDADGDQDLLVGMGYWDDYGWDNAFDSLGNWTKGPLRGWLFTMTNTGTQAAPQYAAPQRLAGADGAIEVYGMPSPNLADFDGDGDLDLLCGEFVDRFTYFENSGSPTTPRFAAGRVLPFTAELCMITPTVVDWNRDGHPDIVCGEEDGRVAYYQHTGRMVGGVPEFAARRWFQQQAADVKFGALVTPWAVDWDDDGDPDLVCGNTAGDIAVIENLDGGNPPRWAAPVRLLAAGQPIRIEAGPNGSIQGPCERKWGYTTLSVADWGSNDLRDIGANSIWGKVIWFRNIGAKGKPQLAAAQPVNVAWPTGQAVPKPAWTWWTPEPGTLATQWRTTPVAVDWDRDGLCDLVMLDHEGYLGLWRRTKLDGQLVLLPPERSFVTRQGASLAPLRLNDKVAGGSGRRKLCVLDWDGDGDLDVLLNSQNVELWLNQGVEQGQTVLANTGNLTGLRLAGHTTSPTFVDFDGDGRPEPLVGAEDGYLYYLPHADPQTVDAGDVTISGFGFAMQPLRNGAAAFSNRAYVWENLPNALSGRRFTQTAGGGAATMTITAQRDTTLLVATATSQQPLSLAGWAARPELGFGYTDAGHTKMAVYARQLARGETLTLVQTNWAGLVVILPSD